MHVRFFAAHPIFLFVLFFLLTLTLTLLQNKQKRRNDEAMMWKMKQATKLYFERIQILQMINYNAKEPRKHEMQIFRQHCIMYLWCARSLQNGDLILIQFHILFSVPERSEKTTTMMMISIVRVRLCVYWIICVLIFAKLFSFRKKIMRKAKNKTMRTHLKVLQAGR